MVVVWKEIYWVVKIDIIVVIIIYKCFYVEGVVYGEYVVDQFWVFKSKVGCMVAFKIGFCNGYFIICSILLDVWYQFVKEYLIILDMVFDLVCWMDIFVVLVQCVYVVGVENLNKVLFYVLVCSLY